MTNPSSFGVGSFGKNEGFEIFASVGLFNTLYEHYPKPLIDSIQLHLEDIKIHENHQIFSFSKIMLGGEPFVLYSLYDFSKDYIGRNGYYATCIIVKHYYPIITSLVNHLKEVNYIIAKHIDDNWRVDRKISKFLDFEKINLDIDHTNPIKKFTFGTNSKYGFIKFVEKEISQTSNFFELSKVEQQFYNRVFGSYYTDSNLLNKKKFDIIDFVQFNKLESPSHEGFNMPSFNREPSRNESQEGNDQTSYEIPASRLWGDFTKFFKISSEDPNNANLDSFRLEFQKLILENEKLKKDFYYYFNENTKTNNSLTEKDRLYKEVLSEKTKIQAKLDSANLVVEELLKEKKIYLNTYTELNNKYINLEIENKILKEKNKALSTKKKIKNNSEETHSLQKNLIGNNINFLLVVLFFFILTFLLIKNNVFDSWSFAKIQNTANTENHAVDSKPSSHKIIDVGNIQLMEASRRLIHSKSTDTSNLISAINTLKTVSQNQNSQSFFEILIPLIDSLIDYKMVLDDQSKILNSLEYQIGSIPLNKKSTLSRGLKDRLLLEGFLDTNRVKKLLDMLYILNLNDRTINNKNTKYFRVERFVEMGENVKIISINYSDKNNSASEIYNQIKDLYSDKIDSDTITVDSCILIFYKKND